MTDDRQPKRKLRNLFLDRVDLVGKGSNPDAFVTLFKHDDVSADDAVTLPDNLSKDGNMSDQNEPIEVVKEDEPVAVEVEKADEPKTEQVSKADYEQIAKEAKELRERVEKMEADQRRSDFVEVAKGLDKLPVKADDLGAILDKAEKALGDDYSKLENLLKAANAQQDTAILFKQLSDGNEPEAESFDDKLAKAAKVILEKGDAPTIEQAKSLAMERDRDLRAAYAAERNQ